MSPSTSPREEVFSVMFLNSSSDYRALLKRYVRFALLTSAVSLMVLSGCEEATSPEDNNDLEAAQQLVDEGFQLLSVAFNSDVPEFTAPKAKFEEAKLLDPDNMDANVGLVLCEVGLLSQNQQVLTAVGGIMGPGSFARIAGSDPVGFRKVMGSGISQTGSQVLTPGSWLRWMNSQMARVIQDQPPDLGPLQNVMENVIIPVLDVVILLLESIEAHSDWQLVLTPELTGMQEGQLELDIADILMLDAMINALKSQLHFFVSYNLNIPDFSDTTAVKAAFNQQDGTFLKLRTNGATHLGSTRTSLLQAITRLGQFSIALQAETDDQTDDLIKIDPTGDSGPTSQDLLDIASELNKLSATLNGPQLIEEDFDGDGTDESLTVDLSAYFNNPISDPKQMLPPYQWDSMYMMFLWDGWPEDYTQFVFPNSTLNGIFPGLTTDTVFKAFFGITMFPSPGPFPIFMGGIN